MAERTIILLISGEIASGKTALANKLEEKFGFKILKTREAIIQLARKQLKTKIPDRTFLQKFGTSLDEKEDGRWVVDYFQNEFNFSSKKSSFYVVDSIRILKQINHFRKAFSFSVVHVHLSASESCLKERFFTKEEFRDLRREKAIEKYKIAKSDETERQVHTLSNGADLIIDTDRCTEDDVLIRATGFLKLLHSTCNGFVDVIIGGQFGSEGKGQIAAHIAPEYDCLVRVGGPNAGHSVYEEPQKHVFHLLPSGSYRNQTAKLVLGPGTVINIKQLLEEINYYKVVDEFTNRLVIDENAIIISDEDIVGEQKIKKIISSTGQGVGYATARNLISRLNRDDSHKAKNFKQLKPFIGSSHEVLEEMYKKRKRVLLEGTQGTALSIHHGIYPFVTSRDTTVSGCISEAGISSKRVNKILMVARTYPIRVGGTSGPFLSEEIDLDIIASRSGKDISELRLTEKTTTTKIDRRIAEFSWTLFRKACELNSPTDIAITFTDYFSVENMRARNFNQLTSQTRQFIEEIENCSGAKVSVISTGFDYRTIIDRRNW
jgi:adenylosuccinate synthase